MKNIIQGWANYIKLNLDILPRYITEQAYLRSKLCQSCYPSCPHCGCKAPQLFYAPHKVDALNKWSKMFTEEEWNNLKIKDKIYNPDIEGIPYQEGVEFTEYRIDVNGNIYIK